MRELREKLRKEIIAWEGTGSLHRGTLDELNQIMTEHPIAHQTETDTAEAMTERWFEASQPEDLFAPLVYSEAVLFASVEPSRVRKCGHCALHLYDTSKKGTRRW